MVWILQTHIWINTGTCGVPTGPARNTLLERVEGVVEDQRRGTPAAISVVFLDQLDVHEAYGLGDVGSVLFNNAVLDLVGLEMSDHERRTILEAFRLGSHV